jgi:hypothetical protein
LLFWLAAVIAGTLGFGNLPALPLVPHEGSPGMPAAGSAAERGPATPRVVAPASTPTSQLRSAVGALPSNPGHHGSATATHRSQAQGGSQALTGHPGAPGALRNPGTRGGAPGPASTSNPSSREPGTGGTAPMAPKGGTQVEGSGAGAPISTPSGREIPHEPQGAAQEMGAIAREGAAGEMKRTTPQG